MTYATSSPDQVVPVANASHTHLFPGALITFRAGEFDLERTGRVAISICFTDGSEAAAELVLEQPAVGILEVDSYTTAAGTPIAEKAWGTAAEIGPDAAQVLRVTRRLAL
jgi:hypothetical protein